MKYQEVDNRDKLASYLKSIKNDKDGFYDAVSKVYRYESTNKNTFDGLEFYSYDQNAYDTIGESGWREVLNKSYIHNVYYEYIIEYMALSQFDYTDEQIIEKAKTI